MNNYIDPSLPALGTSEDIAPAWCVDRDAQEKSAPIFSYKLKKGESVLFDWGRKRTGWIEVAGEGDLAFSYASDLEILDLFDSLKNRKDERADKMPSYAAVEAQGKVALASKSSLIHPRSLALRYLRLTNNSDLPVIITSIVMKPSEFPALPAGSFKCSDETLNIAWQMGIDTVHLCTQPGPESLNPVFAPFGSGHVQWDGCRRDREIWGGDLRPASLAWYYNFTDQTPVSNSIYLIMSAQHVGCSEHGLFPGSGSTHQVFYEWAFWEVTCLYEYILHTGDESLIRFADRVLPLFLEWCEKKFSENPDRWIHMSLSWMYTIPLHDEPLPALQASAAIGMQSMVKLFDMLGRSEEAVRSKALWSDIQDRFDKSFWSDDLQAYRFIDPKGDIPRSDLGTNAWALLGDLVPEDKRRKVLDSIKKLHWTKGGSINISPILGKPYAHDNNIWPYANAYEVAARFDAGDVENALEVLRRYATNCLSAGHATLFEMINIDSSLPVLDETGNTLSFCHAWAAQGSWALQRYLLGVAPLAPGWKEFSFNPLRSPLDWVRGSVVTPFGMIDVELELVDGKFKGKLTHPAAIRPTMVGEGLEMVEIIAKQC